MYPLQLLTGDVLLATILGMSATTKLQAVVGREPMPAASIPSVLQMPAPHEGTKCWCHSSNLRQEEEEIVELDDTAKGMPSSKMERGEAGGKAAEGTSPGGLFLGVRSCQGDQAGLLQDPIP